MLWYFIFHCGTKDMASVSWKPTWSFLPLFHWLKRNALCKCTRQCLFGSLSAGIYCILEVNKDTMPIHSHTARMQLRILYYSCSSVSLKYCRRKKKSSKRPFLCLLINDVHTETMSVEELFALLCLAKSWKSALVENPHTPSLSSAHSK